MGPRRHEGGDVPLSDPVWYEDPAFWHDIKPFLFRPVALARAAGEVDGLLDLVDLSPGARVLDLGCGIGRHSLELARRGYDVTGVDVCEEFLADARGGAAGLRIEFVLDDMRSFRRPGSYDLAVSLFTSLGFFDDPDDDRAILTNAIESLRPGGRLVVELMAREILERVFFADRESREGDVRFVEHCTVEPDWSRTTNELTIEHPDRTVEVSFSLRIYSAPKLEALLHECGAGRVDVFGSLDGRPYDADAERLVLVATGA
jgi:SAM-dependent methyltransferase